MVTFSINNELDIMMYIAVEIIICLILTLISIHALIHIFCKQNDGNSNNNVLYHTLIRSIQITTIASILSYNLSVIFILIWDILTIFGGDMDLNLLIFGDIGIGFECLARILFQITFIFRLQTCFHGTTMQFSQPSIYTLYTLTVLLLIPGIGLLININSLRWYSAIFWLLTDWIISITMSWLFLSKLYHVMYRSHNINNTLPTNRPNVDTKPSMISVADEEDDDDDKRNNIKDTTTKPMEIIKPPSPTQPETENEDDIKDDIKEEEEEEEEKENKIRSTTTTSITTATATAIQIIPATVTSNVINSNIEQFLSPQRDLIMLMTKYTLNVSVAYLSSLFSVIIIFIIRQDIELIIYQNAKYIEHLIITINIFINMLCLYLSYAFNNKYYHFICKFGHKLCNNCCIECISRKMRNDIATQQLL